MKRLSIANILTVTNILTCLFQADISSRFTGWRGSLRLVGSHVPSVDVFVTYCGEGIDVLMDTIHTVCALDYPLECFHIYILDDHGRDGAQDALKAVQKTFANVHYLHRGQNVRTHSKAANLNFGMLQSAAEFVAVLDVDMIPEPCWLRAMLPHILEDDRVAMSNPPQDFYNIPDNDILGVSSEWRWLSDVLMPMQDCASKAWCTGSGFVVRRQAIADIGGFPTESIQEDVLTSTLMTAQAWKTVHVHEVVQWGLCPTSLAGVLKQRARLAAGVVSLAVPGQKDVDRKHRLDCLAVAAVYSFGAAVVTIAAVGIPALVAFGYELVNFQTTMDFNICFWLGIVDCSCQLLYGIAESGLSDYRLPVMNGFKGMWSAPHRLAAVTGTLISDGTLWKPTGLSFVDETELYSWPLWRRWKYVFLDCMMAAHLLVFGACLFGAWSWVRQVVLGDFLSQDTWLRAMTGLGWPPLFLFWTCVLSNTWIPLAYATLTPRPVARASLIERRTDSGAPTPTVQARLGDEKRAPQWQAFVIAAWMVVAGVSFCVAGKT